MIVLWGTTIYEQFGLLAGRSAPHEFLQLVIYKAMTFSDEIEQIDTVRAYHVSSSLCGEGAELTVTCVDRAARSTLLRSMW